MSESVDMCKGVYRRVYAGFIRGKRINQVSLEAEAIFWRLNMLADDYGNLLADGDFFAQDLGGRRRITDDAISAALNDLERAGLIRTYTARGERHVSIVDFEAFQKTRNGRRANRVPLPEWQSEKRSVPQSPPESLVSPVSPDAPDSPVYPSNLISSGMVSSGIGTGIQEEGESEREKPTVLPKKTKPPAIDAAAAKWPETHDTPEVREAWADWVAYKREQHGFTYKPIALKRTVSELAKYPPDAVVWSLSQAMARGWKGARPEDWSPNGNGTHRPAAGGKAWVDTNEQRRQAKRDKEYGADEPLDIPYL